MSGCLQPHSHTLHGSGDGFFPLLVCRVLPHIRPPLGSFRLLDAGCGRGRLAAAVSRVLPLAHVQGIDSCQTCIEAAKLAHPTLTLVRGDVLQLKPKTRFDTVVCLESMRYADTEERAMLWMEGVDRALYHGGVLIVGDLFSTDSLRMPGDLERCLGVKCLHTCMFWLRLAASMSISLTSSQDLTDEVVGKLELERSMQTTLESAIRDGCVVYNLMVFRKAPRLPSHQC